MQKEHLLQCASHFSTDHVQLHITNDSVPTYGQLNLIRASANTSRRQLQMNIHTNPAWTIGNLNGGRK